MLVSTRGIVLHSIKYSETSLVCRIFTEELGLQSYLLQGVRGSKKGNKAALFRPLNLLNMVVYHKRESKGLQKVKEYNLEHIYTDMPFNIRKSSIAMFVSEVLNHLIKEELHDPELFQYLHDWLTELDSTTDKLAYKHLGFLLDLSVYFGFKPEGQFNKEHPYFDLVEGCFVHQLPIHPNYIKADLSAHLATILSHNQPAMTKHERDVLLEKLLLFYRYHVEGFPQLKSHKILSEILA